MADQIRHRSVTVPAGTARTSPLETSLAFPGGEVEEIWVMIPAGHAGLTGFALSAAHQPVIPFDPGEFIIAENDRLIFRLDDYPDSGSWQFLAYNEDVFPHTFYITFHLQIVRQAIVIVGGPTPYAAPSVGANVGNVIIPVGEPGSGDGGTVDIPPGPDEPPTDIPDVPGGDDGIPDEPLPPDEPDEPFPPDVPDEPLPPDEPIPEPPPEPEPVEPPPPPPPGPVGQWAEIRAWKSNGHVIEVHVYISGPRAVSKVVTADLGDFGKPPASLSAALRARGWESPPNIFTAEYGPYSWFIQMHDYYA